MITKNIYVSFIWFLYFVLGTLITLNFNSILLGFIVPFICFILRMPTIRELYPNEVFKG